MYKHKQTVGILLLGVGMAFAMHGCSSKNDYFEEPQNNIINVEVGLEQDKKPITNIVENNSTDSNNTTITDNNSTIVKDNNNTLIASNDNNSSITNSTFSIKKVPVIVKNNLKKKKSFQKKVIKNKKAKLKKEAHQNIKPKIFVIKASEFFPQ